MTIRAADATDKKPNGAAALDSVTDAIGDAAKNARETAQAAITKGREVLDQGCEAVSDFSDTAQEYVSRNAGTAYRGARDSAEQAGKDVVEFVRERPLSALAVAFGAGLLGALLVNRLRR